MSVLVAALLVAAPASVTAVTNPYLQLQWTRIGSAPVVPSGPVGSWDHYGAIAGAVLNVNGVYHLFYTGNDGTSWAIGHATSRDGVTWTKDPANPILQNAQSPVVLYEGGLFKMWWVDPTTPTYAINYATSTDGSSWVQSSANPVLTVSASGWDSSLITTGAILHDASGYRLWYTGTADHATFSGGLATSPDGVHWTKYAGNPVLRPQLLGNWTLGFVTPSTVFSDGSTLVLWFVGGAAGSWQLGVAVSQDGTSWTGTDNPVLSAEPTSWDSNQISRASVLRVQDSLWMWYTGMGGGTQQVGLAKAPAPSVAPSTSSQPGFFDSEAGYLVVIGIMVVGGGGVVAAFAYLARPRRPGET